MKMTLEQTKLVGLTMELDLKAREYNKLCKNLEDLKSKNTPLSSPAYVELKNAFEKNKLEIEKITEQLKELNKN